MANKTSSCRCAAVLDGVRSAYQAANQAYNIMVATETVFNGNEGFLSRICIGVEAMLGESTSSSCACPDANRLNNVRLLLGRYQQKEREELPTARICSAIDFIGYLGLTLCPDQIH